MVNLSIVYLFHAIYCLVITSVGIILTIQTFGIWKIFEQYCSGMELIMSEMSESRLERGRVDSINMAVEVWNEPLLANIVFPKIHIGV